MVALAEALAEARELAPLLEGRRALPEDAVLVVPWSFTPWWAQRMFLRAEKIELVTTEGEDGVRTTVVYEDGKPTRMIVAGRQSGKTEVACRKVLRVMGEEPGSFSLLLAPVYKNAQATIDKIKAVMAECGLEALGWKWKEQQKRLIAPNGSILAVFSADSDDSVRGPTITGVLWFDEAAMLSTKARQVALAALTASRNPRQMITTTPMGLNWVYGMWGDNSPEAKRVMTRVRFRSEDSPHANKAMIAEARRTMSLELYQQEYEAVFVASLFLVFPAEIRERMWVDELKRRDVRTAHNVLGIDLGKEQDWCVLTLGNKFHEYVPIGRWQHEEWPVTLERIASAARAHNAICVVDQGHGGGYGNVVADFLRREGIRVVTYNTGNRGKKAAMVEDAKASCQHYAVKLLKNSLFEVYDLELGQFQGKQRSVQGQKINVYEGPQLADQHDDCPISFCLAHWGVKFAWEDVWESNVDIKKFKKQPGLSGPPRGRGPSGGIGAGLPPRLF